MDKITRPDFSLLDKSTAELSATFGSLNQQMEFVLLKALEKVCRGVELWL